MASILKTTIMGALLLAVVAFGTSQAQADPVTFTTSGIFTCGGCSGSGSNSVTFLGGMGNAFMLTFTGLGSNADFARIGIIAAPGSGETIKSVTLLSLFKEEKQNEFSVAATIPEPETYAMLALGIALLGVAARRRNMI